MEGLTENEDVSEKFFKLCEGLTAGDLVTMPIFRLNEVMSAIELCEPKMDVAVGTNRKMGLKASIEKGLYTVEVNEQLATIDGTICMLVAWLEGGSLSSTLWTNVLLLHSQNVQHSTYKPWAQAFGLIIRNIFHVISSSGNGDELHEDFHPDVVFTHESYPERLQLVSQIREQIHVLSKTTWNSPNKDATEECKDITLALSARLEFVCLMIELFQYLVSPSILFPTGTRHDEEYEIRTEPNGESPSAENEAEEEDEDVENEEYQGDSFEDYETFVPMISNAVTHCEKIRRIIRAMAKSHHMGKQSPTGQDEDFSWLPAFEPKLNIKLAPACFPRKTMIPSRKDAYAWMIKFCDRLHEISEKTPKTTSDLISLFNFARQFNFNNSCVFTRSLLQVVMFPSDDHLLGDINKTVADPIEATLKENFEPHILVRNSPANLDPVCRHLYNLFIANMSKIVISVYSMIGCNLSRQRDRLETTIDEMTKLQLIANRIEFRTSEVMTGSVDSAKEREIPPHSVAAFVFSNLLALVTHYFDLSLRMDLFVPFEFTYVYWYIGDVLARWQVSNMEKQQEMMLSAWKQNPLSTNVNPRRTKERARFEASLKRRLNVNQVQMFCHYGIAQLCDGIIVMTVALIKLGQIRMPSDGAISEQLRYERRMEPFENLGNPLYLSYADYKENSRIDAVFETPLDQLIVKACHHFESATKNFEKILDKPDLTEDTMFLIFLKVSKSNLVAVRCLSKMDDLSTKRIEWAFSAECPLYPQLKISKK